MKKNSKSKNQSQRAKRQKNYGGIYHNPSLNLSSLQEFAKEVAIQQKIDEAIRKLEETPCDYKVRIPGGWACIPKGCDSPEMREKLHELVAVLEATSHE